MDTTIEKRIKSKHMDAMFQKMDIINIRYFKAKKYDERTHDENKIYTYSITIRHNEDQNPKKLFESALSEVIKENTTEYTLIHKKRLAGTFEAEKGDCINGLILSTVNAYFKSWGAYIIKNITAPTEQTDFTIEVRLNVSTEREIKTFTIKPVKNGK